MMKILCFQLSSACHFTGLRVNADDFALLDKQWYANRQARF
jgi:hypothetical protein